MFPVNFNSAGARERESGMLSFRQATMEDADLLFIWRNDPVTRLGSHSDAEFDFESHLSWLKSSLASQTRDLLIVEENGLPVGTVRIDYPAVGVAALSWTVAPEARGRGVGKRMVRLAVEMIPASCIIRAEVKVENTASIKVAEAAGLGLIGQEKGVLYYEK